MAPKSFSSLFLATAVLFTSVTVEAQLTKPSPFQVNPFCLTSDYKRMCTRMAMGASNQNQASANVMQSTLGLARHAKAILFLLRPDISHLDPQSQASIMSTCTDHFENTISDIEDSIEALKSNNIGSLRAKLSAAFRTDCDDELKQMGVQSPQITKFIKLIQKGVDNSLAVVMQN